MSSIKRKVILHAMHNQQVELCIITVIKYEAKTQYLTNKDPSTVTALCCKAHRKRHYNLQSDFFFLCYPANIKGANKHSKIFVGRSTIPCTIFSFALILCPKYVINTFLLASSSILSKQLLCFVHGEGA